MTERSLILIKPEGIEKNLIGEIISRLEKANLKIKAMKMLIANEEKAEKHYPVTEEWAFTAFTKSKQTAEKEGREFNHENHMDFGKDIQSRLKQALTRGPIVSMVVEGDNAVYLIRQLTGHTEPKQAEKGTIRGDFSDDSYEVSDKEKRALYNIIHASSSLEDAEKEIEIWFQEHEIL